MLRLAEYFTLALTMLNVYAFACASISATAHHFLKCPLLLGSGLFFLLVFLLVANVSALARARRPKLSPLDEAEGLSLEDFRAVMRLAPRLQKVLALVGLVCLVLTFVVFGSVSWSSGSAFERRHALGIALYIFSLSALLLPIFGAFSRLPSSVAERVDYLRRKNP